MQISRRDALMGASAAVAVAGVPTAVVAQPDPLLAGVQALVEEIRQDLNTPAESFVTHAFVALQEAADRLEALPGIEHVDNEFWDSWEPEMRRIGFEPWRVLRLAGEARS